MSNVFAKYHTPTGNEFYDKALYIKRELTRLVMNEKVMPKRYRFVYSIPIINKVTELLGWITAEITLYPTSEALVEKKKEIWYKALICNEQIIQMIQDMIFVLPTVIPEKFEQVGEALIEESKILRECRKNTKLQKSGQ